MSGKNANEEISDEAAVLKGRGFSRAAGSAKSMGFSPEGIQLDQTSAS